MLVRRIANEDDLAKFQNSETYNEVIQFILELNEAARGHEIGFVEPVSANVQAVSSMLDEVIATLERNPAKPSTNRFGKPEYVGFYDELKASAGKWAASITDHPEVPQYFAESFGNRQRIDYGSGHEYNYLCYLLALVKLGKIEPSQYTNVVMGIFPKYLRTMRTVQQTYWLEPAGSHGVWGLDDYHFLPYLFGSGQLVDDKFIRPISIHEDDIVAMYEDTNLYFWCISFINRVKAASLRWHSPMLDDISGVKRWSKVNEGMIKMYKAEVMGKLPIVQHFLFGELLKAPEGVTKPEDINETVHIQCWANCCGIRVPSAIAANEVGGKKSSSAAHSHERRGHVLQKSAAVPVD